MAFLLSDMEKILFKIHSIIVTIDKFIFKERNLKFKFKSTNNDAKHAFKFQRALFKSLSKQMTHRWLPLYILKSVLFHFEGSFTKETEIQLDCWLDTLSKKSIVKSLKSK